MWKFSIEWQKWRKKILKIFFEEQKWLGESEFLTPKNEKNFHHAIRRAKWSEDQQLSHKNEEQKESKNAIQWAKWS